MTRRTPRSAPRRAATSAAALLVLVAGALAGCSRSSGSKAEFCEQVRQVPALESVLARFSEADPDVLADRIDKARAAYDALGDAAPSEIRDETAAVVALVDAVLQAVEDHPSDPAAAADQLRSAMDDHAEAAEARQQVAAYAQEECDVRLDPTLAPSDGTTTSAPAVTSTTTSADTTTTG